MSQKLILIITVEARKLLFCFFFFKSNKNKQFLIGYVCDYLSSFRCHCIVFFFCSKRRYLGFWATMGKKIRKLCLPLKGQNFFMESNFWGRNILNQGVALWHPARKCSLFLVFCNKVSLSKFSDHRLWQVWIQLFPYNSIFSQPYFLYHRIVFSIIMFYYTYNSEWPDFWDTLCICSLIVNSV